MSNVPLGDSLAAKSDAGAHTRRPKAADRRGIKVHFDSRASAPGLVSLQLWGSVSG